MTACSKTNAAIDQLNTAIDQWITWLNGYPLNALHQLPSGGGWSLGQVYMHIIEETRYFVEQAIVCINSNDNANEEMNAHGRRILANGFPDARMNGPSTGVLIPQPESIVQLTEQLLQIEADALQLLSADMSANNGKTAHPGFLYFNGMEWLQFAALHLRHHERQKGRIDGELKK